MKKILLALIVVLTVAPLAIAQSCGYYYPSTSYYYPSTLTYVAPSTSTYVSDDLTIIANAVAARDAVANRAKELTNRHTNFQNTMIKANLHYAIPDLYAQNLIPFQSSVVGYNSTLAGTFGLNTATQYGYQQPSLAQQIDPFRFNLDQASLSLAQATEASIAAGKDLATQHNGTVQFLAAQSSKLSELQLKANIINNMAQQVLNNPTSSSSQLKWNLSPGAPAVMPKIDGTLTERWNASAKSCIACHYDKVVKGNFSVDKFPDLSLVESEKVLERLRRPANAQGHMPQNGPMMSLDEYQAWVEVAQAVKPKK